MLGGMHGLSIALFVTYGSPLAEGPSEPSDIERASASAGGFAENGQPSFTLEMRDGEWTIVPPTKPLELRMELGDFATIGDRTLSMRGAPRLVIREYQCDRGGVLSHAVRSVEVQIRPLANPIHDPD